MIAWRFKELAKEKGISIHELAKAAGISAGALYKIERGESDPKFKTLLTLSKALGVKLDELFSEFV